MIADLKGKSIYTGAILLYCRASPLSAAASDKPLSNMKFVLIGRLQQSKVSNRLTFDATWFTYTSGIKVHAYIKTLTIICNTLF